MVKEIRIYVEGGGERNEAKSAIREGLRTFLRELKIYQRQPSIIACGSRGKTFDMFKDALRAHPEAFNILLVDAEALVEKPPWQHLQQRDGWAKPDQASDEQCHLMVQTMEAWFIADPNVLQIFYGQGFKLTALPKIKDVEQINKDELEHAFKKATQDTQKGVYHKIKHGPKILALVNAQLVRQASMHCERFFSVLISKMSE
jgi:hypothetical protein